MFGLPADFDGSFLVGLTLEMVCFNENQMYLHFSANTMITVESGYSYNSEEIREIPVRESNLMRLLGSSVSRAYGDASGTLSLVFDREQVLRIYDISKQYESYSISHAGKVTIV